ncbi:MAG: hypothetical protein Q9P01_07350 [Anaerolineae bacterium]|nr:hypothetical protein [Anaerolineae bacterium]MDQ7034641.1 hypothetical protein [Anaerolineae bacterium]
MNRKLIFVWLLISLISGGILQAQTSGGQICIRAFEDRNGNAQDDNNEPRIQRRLSATLANDMGVIIDSAFMEDSLNAAAGTLCFQRLDAGQYTLRVVSAEYTFTTETEFITAITNTGVQTFSVGGQLIVSAIPTVDNSGDLQLTSAEQQNLITRLVFAGIGAAVVIGAMAVVGAFIYLIFMRRPAQPVQYATGTYPAIQSPPSTGTMQPVIYPMDATDVPFSRPAPVQYEDDDTNRPNRPNNPADDTFEFTDDDTNRPNRPSNPADDDFKFTDDE